MSRNDQIMSTKRAMVDEVLLQHYVYLPTSRESSFII